MRCTFKTVFYVNGSKERNGNVVVDICMSYDKMFYKDRPCGVKIGETNGIRNFKEVFGLHDYRILISEKWIELLSCKCF